jgi:hypothetical protein
MSLPLADAVSLTHLAPTTTAHAAGATTHTMTMLCLFALLGLAISAVVLPHVAPDTLAWVFSHLE